jgi:hypothetical protein
MIYTDGAATIAWQSPDTQSPADLEHAWNAGYDDARKGRSDFARRSFPTLSGAREAYMRGRSTFFADQRRNEARR